MAFHLPLRSMVAFEAAARLGSFGAAAQELGLTPSAVSHQIRSLEARMGVALFLRMGRGVTVTREGADYARAVAKGFGQLENATKKLSGMAKRHVVQIGTPPSLASRWLLPRLRDFLEFHPNIDLRVNADTRRSDNELDFMIVFGGPAQWGSSAIPLLRETVQPLCSPTLLENGAIRTPRDLLGKALISTRYNAQSWNDWFHHNDLEDGETYSHPVQLDPSHLAIDAALRGMGIVLESDLLTEIERRDGRLIAPLPDSGLTRISYWLLPTDNSALSAPALTAYNWLRTLAVDAKAEAEI